MARFGLTGNPIVRAESSAPNASSIANVVDAACLDVQSHANAPAGNQLLVVSGPNDNHSRIYGADLAVANGICTLTGSFNASLSMHVNGPEGAGHYADGTGTITISLITAGVGLSRFTDIAFMGAMPNGRHAHLSGYTGTEASDPTFTRWLPLAFSPSITSQPYRKTPGLALTAPWGNINCMYSLQMRQEPTAQRSYYDAFGPALFYWPSPGPGAQDSGYASPNAPYNAFANTKDTDTSYYLLDGSGQKLNYHGASMTPDPDIHSQLVPYNGGYQLQNAGPPNNLKALGSYKYTFEPLDPQTGNGGRLLSIEDNYGNKQTIDWGTGIVYDQTSHRQINLSFGAGGYVSGVTAPTVGSSTGTFTGLTWDSTGHVTSIKVYPLGSQTPVRSDTYTYTGDAVSHHVSGPLISDNTYVADYTTADLFGNPVMRILTESVGDLNDTSSSESGGSVMGTTTYHYGMVDKGYNNWGKDVRTNTVTDARGNTTKMIFSMNDNIMDNTLFGNIKTIWMYGPDISGQPSSLYLWKTTYAPDITNPTTKTVVDPFNLNWLTTYDGQGHALTKVDPLQHTWTYNWAGSNLVSTVDPTGATYSYGYNGSHLTSLSDAAGTSLVSATLNGFGQVLTATTPAGAGTGTTQYTYDSYTGDLTKITNPVGDVATINSYDALGDPLSSTVYPDTGNPATSQTPLTTTVAYDAGQMPTLITDPTGSSMAATYNSGVLTQLKILNSGQTLAQLGLSVDSRGRVYAISDLVGTGVQYRYDGESNLMRVVDGRGNSTVFTYDQNNAIKSTTWPDNHGSTITRDLRGLTYTVTDERGTTFTYGRDDGGRVTYVAVSSDASKNRSFTYDAAGRLQTTTDASSSLTYHYDSHKRIDTVTTMQGGRSYVIGYTYNNDGTIATLTSPVGPTTYLYDANRRMTQLTNPYGETTTWTYDHIGRMTGQTTTPPSGAAISTTYAWGISGTAGDASTAPAYLRQITQRINNVVAQTYTNTHSLLGQRTVQSGAGADGTTETAQYVYDLRGRLTSETSQFQIDPQHIYTGSGTYTYDASNNLQGGTNGWTYNNSNQVTNAPAQGGLAGATGLAYDYAGNMTAGSGMTFAYNVWNHLMSVSGSASASYNYDLQGRRFSKTTSGTTTYFIYAGDTLLAETDASGNVLRSYTWGVGGLISDRTGTTGGLSRFYLFDEGGNTRMLVDTGGSILWRGAWNAWGTPLTGMTQPSTPYGWGGRVGLYRDSETGLLLAGARYYAPALGRFTQRDPSGFSAGPNVYQYAFDDPLDFFDANGMWPDSVSGYYMSGAGGFDEYAMNGAMGGFGEAYGRWETGKGSGWSVLGHGLWAGVNLVGAAFLVKDIAMIGVSGGRKVLCKLIEDGCFVVGTPVQLANGKTVPIEQMKNGQRVASRNPRTGKTEAKKVLRTTVRKVDLVLKVSLLDLHTGKVVERLTTTRNHPFYVQGKGFVPAGGLAIGNAIVTRAGPELVVAKIEWLRKAEGYVVYNFEVTDNHTYFVGKANGGTWVHNPECPLAYGPSAGGKLAEWAALNDAETLSALANPDCLRIIDLSKLTLNEAAASGRKVMFDLTHMSDIEGILANTGPHAAKITSQELRYIRNEWVRFEKIVDFYREGENGYEIVNPPWIK